MNEEELEQAAHRVHAVPHSHYVNDVEVGHHRLKLLAATVEVTCGIEHEHPRHPWTERSGRGLLPLGLAFPCPGIPDAAESRRRRETARIFHENAVHGLGEEVSRRWVLIGRMDEAQREDAGTHAYTVMESFSLPGVTEEWVTVSSEGDDHQLVDALAGKVVRVIIEIIGGA